MRAEKGKQKASAAPGQGAGARSGASASGAAEKQVKQPEKSKVRRIHVSGLPAISEADVKDRFKSFGTVTGVDGLGKLDGNGNPLRYAFVDIDITKSKLAQCMNLLSGSVWKGSTLRIAEAKPTFMDRIAREREQASQQAAETSTTEAGSEQTSKKRKRTDGIQSKDIELANGENVKNRAGWKLDPQSSTPIFPIVARPDHPLPALPSSKKAEKAKVQPAAKVKADGKKDKKALKKEKAAAAAAAAPVDPPNRAQRVKIDPTKWQPKHLREKEFPRTSASGSSAMPNLEEPEEEQASTSGYSDSDADSASSEASGEPDEREDESEEDMPLVSESATRKTDNQVASAAPIDSDSSDAGATERKRQMDLIASMLGGRLPESISASEIEKVAAGADFNAALSSDSSTSSEEEADLVPEDADVMETVSNDVEKAPQEIAVQEDELAVNDGVAESASTSSSEEDEPAEEDAPTQPAAPTIQMQSLTEMFKPQESVAGFTLGGFLDDLDLDLEELPELGAGSGPVASETAQPLYRSAAPPTRSQPVLQRAGAYDPHEPLFFPFPFEEDDQPGGLIHGMPESQKKELLERSWTGTSTFKRFKRTQNIEEITTQYEAARKVLNEQVRKRHREAAKRRKRSGGRGDRKVDADDDE